MNITLKTYAKVAPEFARRHFNSKFWANEYTLFKKLIKGKKVVDIGCGTGRDARLFTQDKFDYLGTDASSAMLKVAKKLVPKAKFKIMDMTRLKLPTRSFDGFWSSASLLHIPKAKVGGVLESLGKILKDDGVGFISIKFKPRAWEGMVEDAYPGFKRFFAYYTKSAFQNLLAKHRFKVVKFRSKINYVDPDKTRWLCFFVKKA